MKRSLFLITSALLITVLSTGIHAQKITDQDKMVKYLNEKEKAYEDICVEFGLNTWNLYSMEAKSDLPSVKMKFSTFFNDDDLKWNVNNWNEKLINSSDKILAGRLRVWKKTLDGSKVDFDPEIVKASASLLEEVRNRDSKNAEQSKMLEKKILDLIKLRNKKAVEAGFKNYPEYVLEMSGLGAEWFNGFINEIDKRTSAVYKELYDKINSEKGNVPIQDIVRTQQFFPDPEFSNDSLYIMMKETLANIGLDYNSLPIRFVVKEADFGGNCIAVNVPNDLRVVMVPNMPISVYLHELGHGLQWLKADINYPILEGYEWCAGAAGPAFAEGMAEVLANFCRQSLWYKKYSNLSDEQIAERNKVNKYAAAVQLRLNMIQFLSEIELYKNPDADLQELLKGIYKKYLYTDQITRRFSVVNTIYVDYPIYIHNYQIADIIGWQVHNTLRKKFGENYVADKNVGKFLTDNLYKNGLLKPWKEILKDATGSEIDLDGYLKSKGL